MALPLAHTSRLTPLISPFHWSACGSSFTFTALAPPIALGLAACLWSDKVYGCFADASRLWPVCFDRLSVSEVLAPLASVARGSIFVHKHLCTGLAALT